MRDFLDFLFNMILYILLLVYKVSFLCIRIDMDIGFFSILLICAAVIILWAISTYNSLVRQSNLVKEGWSGIDVQLKRRSDLIPNLVETVKGYSFHEKEVLENVTKMRSLSQQAGTLEDKIAAENQLTGALKTLFAVAENYPDLKANEHFRQLQHDLSELERELQLARRYYNGTARNYNTAIQSFPANVVARLFSFAQKPYIEIENKDKETPKVRF